MVLVPGVGHLPQVEAPDAFAELIGDRDVSTAYPTTAPVDGTDRSSPGLVSATTPYPWPYDGALAGTALALLVLGWDETWWRRSASPDRVRADHRAPGRRRRSVVVVAPRAAVAGSATAVDAAAG